MQIKNKVRMPVCFLGKMVPVVGVIIRDGEHFEGHAGEWLVDFEYEGVKYRGWWGKAFCKFIGADH